MTGKEISENVIKNCKQGDRAAQRELYNALAAKMFAVCIRYMGDRDAAEDILQVKVLSKDGPEGSS